MPSNMTNCVQNAFSEKVFITLKQLLNNRIALYEIKKSGLFDKEWYLSHSQDVADAGICPILHYVTHGWKEGRSPNPLFDAQWYLETNKDIAGLEIDPFCHYSKTGWKEGRSPNPLFNVRWYLETNSDVAKAGSEPLWHYQTHGWKARCSPDPLFDLSWYLGVNKDIAALGCEPLQHYQRYGYKEGRVPNALLSKVCLPNILVKKYGPQTSQEIIALLGLLQNIDNKDSNDPLYREVIGKLKGKIKELPISKITNNSCDVSIIIPVHNQLAYTLACVNSLLKLETKCSYEILIGDDASTDNTKEVFSHLHPSIKLMYQKENLGFLRTCNAMARQAKGPYLLFLNNDTLMLPGSLDALVDTFEARKDAGLVGAKLLNSDGTLQEAGGIIWNDGSGWNYGRGDDPEKPEYNYVREVDYCSGACIMLPKVLWDKIGGFDERYVPAYCEDSDIAFKVRQAGKKVYCQYVSEIIHLEGKSNGTEINQGLKSYQVINNKKLFSKWGSVFLREHGVNGVDAFKFRDRSLNKKTILIIDHYLPHYDKDAGSKTIWEYIKLFVNNGLSVKFLGDNFMSVEPYQKELQQMGVEVLTGAWAQRNWEAWINENGKYLDYVLLSRAHIGIKYLQLLKQKTSAKILFYGHDLLSRTFQNNFNNSGNEDALVKSKKWEDLEKTIINNVDVIYYPSYLEVDYLKKSYVNHNIKVLPPYVFDAQKQVKVTRGLASNKILFVGGFAHPPNIEAITWFVKKIWPAVQHIFPNLKLTIAGSSPTTDILVLASKNIIVTGFVSELTLSELYYSHDIAIVPLLSGGGIKGKVIEALAHGTPILTTPTGAEGIPNAEKYMNICSVDHFASALIAMLRPSERRQQLSRAAPELISKYYSEQALFSVVSQDVDLS